MEIVFVHYELLVLTYKVGRMLAENSFLSFGKDVRLTVDVLVDVEVRAEEALTVLFFLFVAGLGTLLQEFYCLVVRVT